MPTFFNNSQSQLGAKGSPTPPGYGLVKKSTRTHLRPVSVASSHAQTESDEKQQRQYVTRSSQTSPLPMATKPLWKDRFCCWTI